MKDKEYELEFNVRIGEPGRGYDGLQVSNRYKVKAGDLLHILKILAELEAYTKKLTEEG